MSRVNVVHAIIRQDDKFLLGKRSLAKRCGPGYWATIGGSVETGESLEDGLRRECREEVGVNVLPLEKIHIIEEPTAIHHWFEVKIVEGEPFIACDENTELRWFTIEEIVRLSPVTPEDLQILRLMSS